MKSIVCALSLLVSTVIPPYEETIARADRKHSGVVVRFGSEGAG